MEFREKVLKCLGKLPEKCDLHLEILSMDDMGDYKRAKVRYNVELNDRVDSYLLIPGNLKKNVPGIIAAHQHAGQYYLGKSEPAGLSLNSMYHYGLDLCRRGYVVLCPDHLAFEDRRPPEFIRKENPQLDDGNFEKLLFCKYFSEGSTLQAKYVWDLSRGVDVLQSLDYVDSSRIGAIGHSLGGHSVMWLTWFDNRIKAAVSSCGISQISSYFSKGINHSFSFFVFGLLEFADIADIVSDIAPRPFMMTNGADDIIFPIEGVKEIARKAEDRYSSMNMASNFKSIIFQGGHTFPDEVKVKAYDWLDKHLNMKSS